MILCKYPHTFIQQGILMVLNERSAGTQALLVAAGGYQRNGTYTVVHQLFGQFAATHTRIADGKIESVGYRFA